MSLVTLLSIQENGQVEYNTINKRKIHREVLKYINGICDFKRVQCNIGYYHDSECGAKRLKRNRKAEGVLHKLNYFYSVFGPVVFVGVDQYHQDTSIPSTLGFVR